MAERRSPAGHDAAASVSARLLGLVATALPGVQALVTLWLVARFADLKTVGQVAGDIGVANFLGFFTAIGWSALLLVRLPRLRPARQAQLWLAILPRAALQWLLALPLLWLLGRFGVLASWEGAALYLVGWSGYQLARHFALANRAFGWLVAGECACIGAAAAGIALSDRSAFQVLLCLAAPAAVWLLAFAGWAVWYCRGCGIRCRIPVRSGWKVSQAMGLTNAMSGGTATLLPPLVRTACGDLYSGMLGAVLAMLKVLLLFPRALSFQELAPLTRAASKGDSVRVARCMAAFRKQLLAVLAAALAGAIAAWGLGAYRAFGIQDGLAPAHIAFALSLLSFLVSQAIIPEANLLMVMERLRAQLRINLLGVASFAAGIALVLFPELSPQTAFVALLVVQLLSASVRSVGTLTESRKAMRALRQT